MFKNESFTGPYIHDLWKKWMIAIHEFFLVNRNRETAVRWITPRRYEPNVKIFAFASCTNCSPYPLILVAFLIQAFTVCHNIWHLPISIGLRKYWSEIEGYPRNRSTWSSLPKTSSRETASSWLSYRPALERYWTQTKQCC
jgi:hypothetical protein